MVSIATTAVVVSAGAATTASSANTTYLAFCEEYIQGFQDAQATIKGKQQYASCIDVLHPQNESEMAFFVTALLVLGIFSFVIMLSIGLNKRSPFDRIEAWLLATLAGFCIPMILGTLWVIIDAFVF